jgi:CD109 antigen
MKWWRKPIGVDGQKNPWYGLPNSVDVEMTAYGLLTYIQRGLVQDALPVMKWLITQRNEQGGFASTQVNTLGVASCCASIQLVLYDAVNRNKVPIR